jgi:hypothetical protein
MLVYGDVNLLDEKINTIINNADSHLKVSKEIGLEVTTSLDKTT